MSHFSRIQTRLVEADFLIQALQDLGYEPQSGELTVRGFGGQQAAVHIRIASPNPGYDIGFARGEQGYTLVADWYGLPGFDRDAFQKQVSGRYAYHAARARLEAQGFTLVSESQEQGQVHLVLRRVSA